MGELIEIGLTDVVENTASYIILNYLEEQIGWTPRAEQSVATVESGKWCLPSAVPGGLDARRGELCARRGAGTDLLRSRRCGLDRPDPADRLGVRHSRWPRLRGAQGIAAYEQFLDREGIFREEMIGYGPGVG